MGSTSRSATRVAHLEALPDGSLGAIVSIQVIEHLPRDGLRGCSRSHAPSASPGGLFVAETVNPHAAHALKTFWVDLTHEHPIFPEVALALAGGAGYREAFIAHPRVSATPSATASPSPPTPSSRPSEAQW